jgi:hypothetical protein
MNGLSQLDNVNFDDPATYESISNRSFEPLPLPAPNDKPLRPTATISANWSGPLPEGHLQVLVSVPGQKMSPVALPTNQNNFAPAVTLNTIDRDLFGRSDTVENNNIHELDGDEPDFLMEFITKLRQHRWIKSGTEVCFFRSHIPSSY